MKKTLRICLIAIAALVVLLALLLQTGTGKSRLIPMLAKHFSGIAITGLHGHIPSDMRLDHLAIADAQGTWLEADDMHLAWHPLALLRGQWRIETLSAAHIRLLRQPISTAKKTGFALPHIPDVSIDTLSLGDIALDPPVTGHAQRLTVTGGGDAHGYRLTAQTLEGPSTTLSLRIAPGSGADAVFDEAPGGMLGSLFTWASQPIHATMHATNDADAIHLTQAQITAGSSHLAGSGELAANHTLTGEFTLAIPDMADFSSLAGALQAKLTLTGAMDAPQFTLQGASDKLSVSGHIFDALTFAATGTLHASALTGASFNAASGPYHIDGTADADMHTQQFNATLHLAPVQLPGSQGELTGTAAAQGSFSQFTHNATLTLTRPQANATVTVKGAADLPRQHFTATLDGHAAADKASFTLAASATGDAAAIAITGIQLKGQGLTLTGNADWLMPAMQARAQLLLAATDLRPLGQWLRTPLSGQAHAALTLTPGPVQEGSLTMQATSLRLNTFTLDTLNASLQGNDHAIAATARMQGNRLTLALDAAGERSSDTTDIALKNLSGTYSGEPFALSAPAHLRLRGDNTELTPARIALAGGSLNLKASATPSTIAAELKAQDIALDKLPISGLPAGTLQALLTLSGSMANPTASLTAAASLPATEIPLSLNLKSQWRSGKLTAAATVNSSLLTAKAELPAAFSLSPLQFGLSGDTPLRGTLAVDAPLKILNAALYAQGLRVGGTLTGSGQLSGTAATPTLRGNYALKEGRLDHQQSGICLRGATASLLATETGLTLKNISADASGHLSGNATIDFTGNHNVTGAVDFTHFALFCGGAAKGAINGHLAATGTLQTSSLKGRLTLGPLNVQLPGSTPGQIAIPQIKTIVANRKTTERQPAESPLTLDIALDAPGRVFVRGRGLDAEFAGSLAITGPVTQLAYEGAFHAENGRFALLDRDLKLTDATLRFNGPIPPSPFLDVTAETTAQDTAVQVHLTGDVRKPEFTFTSTPARPKDEIMALLLFGRSLSALTPFQAVQLAQSVAELTGQSSGPGVLGKIRGALGVDRLDVGTGTDNSVTVGAGKYITDKVYVGVSQGAKPEDRAVNTEIELTPSVSATSSLDAVGNQGVGLKWKYDY
jgi:translocation and assembly module TamB